MGLALPQRGSAQARPLGAGQGGAHHRPLGVPEHGLGGGGESVTRASATVVLAFDLTLAEVAEEEAE